MFPPCLTLLLRPFVVFRGRVPVLASCMMLETGGLWHKGCSPSMLLLYSIHAALSSSIQCNPCCSLSWYIAHRRDGSCTAGPGMLLVSSCPASKECSSSGTASPPPSCEKSSDPGCFLGHPAWSPQKQPSAELPSSSALFLQRHLCSFKGREKQGRTAQLRILPTEVEQQENLP